MSIQGDWHLLIYCCHWELELHEDSAHDGSSREQISSILNLVEGQALTSVSVIPSAGTSEFEFDLGAILRTTAYENLDSQGRINKNWTLYEPTGYALGYYADGTHDYEHEPHQTDSK